MGGLQRGVEKQKPCCKPQPSLRIHLHNIRGRTTRMPGTLNALHSHKRRNTQLNRMPRQLLRQRPSRRTTSRRKLRTRRLFPLPLKPRCHLRNSLRHLRRINLLARHNCIVP